MERVNAHVMFGERDEAESIHEFRNIIVGCWTACDVGMAGDDLPAFDGVAMDTDKLECSPEDFIVQDEPPEIFGRYGHGEGQEINERPSLFIERDVLPEDYPKYSMPCAAVNQSRPRRLENRVLVTFR